MTQSILTLPCEAGEGWGGGKASLLTIGLPPSQPSPVNEGRGPKKVSCGLDLY
jgi:hypothetical protein